MALGTSCFRCLRYRSRGNELQANEMVGQRAGKCGAEQAAQHHRLALVQGVCSAPLWIPLPHLCCVGVQKLTCFGPIVGG